MILAVLVLKGMVIFAGEIKNKAEKLTGQGEDEPGWSFLVAVIGLLQSVTGLVLAVMFRELPTSEPGRKGGSWLRPVSCNAS